MKKIKFLLALALVCAAQYLAAQQPKSTNRLYTVNADMIELSFAKTSNVIFPFPIISVDRGSGDILVQKAPGVDNILQLKAGQKNFADTNLTVITGDGVLYNFVVCYNEIPERTSIAVNTPGSGDDMLFTPPYGLNKATIIKDASFVAHTSISAKSISAEEFGLRVTLDGIFIKDGIMFLRLKFKNASSIDYDVDLLHFFIRDKKIAKRTASQEVEVPPVYIHDNIQKILHQSEQVMVVALPKFTIPDKKFFCIQLMEKWGGRHLELHIRHRLLHQALPIF